MSAESSTLDVGRSAPRAVFLSYASQDAEAAKRIADALRSAGVEVWFDAEGGLEHGDEWDAKIRRQIKECVLFIAVISANTQARPEGYFRIEWDLAAERARGIASGVPFLLPILVDDTREPDALVPDRFRTVQWTRVRGGELSGEMLTKLVKLWSHRLGFLKQQSLAAPVESRTTEAVAPAAARRWASLLTGTAVMVALAAGAWWWRGRGVVAPPTSAAVTSTGAAAPTAPTRDWPRNPELKRAYELSNELNSIREDLLLAEEVAKKAVEKSPADAEAVTVLAHVESTILVRNFDFTADRTAQARRYCERAAQLAPDHPVALAALAMFLTQRGGDQARAEELLRRVCSLDPAEPRYARFLALVVSRQNGAEGAAAALRMLQENITRFPQDALSHYNLGTHYRDAGNYADAEREFDAALALAPVANAADWKARFAMMRGDFATAKAWLERVPPRMQAEERAVLTRVAFALFTGEVAYGWGALNKYPEPWFYDISNFTGPRSLLIAALREREGKSELARSHCEAALTEIRRYREAHPADPGTQAAEAWAWLGLGRLDEARAAHRIAMASQPRPLRHFPPGLWWFGAIPRIFLLEERDKILATVREVAEVAEVRAPLLARIRMDPRLAAFHQDAEIVTMLAPAAAGGATSAKTADAKSVAVLPFANLSDDKANEYFSDGISEELLTVLQKIPGLHVAARTSAFSFKGRNATAQEIGEKLGVATLVEGSVQKSGNRVKVTARLSRVTTGEELWSRSYTRELKDAFALQEELATAIIGELVTQLPGGPSMTNRVKAAVRGGTANAEAHQLFLQGRFLQAQFSMENLVKAIGCFERATELDPDFALAWAARARAHAMHVGWTDRMTRAEFEAELTQARQAADRALALEPDLPEGLNARFEVQFNYDFDWAGGAALMERALAMAPADPVLISAASRVAGISGRREQAVELLRQAVALDPVNAEIRVYLAIALVQVRRWDEARREFARVAALSPTTPWACAGIGLADLYEGKFTEALGSVARETSEFARQLVSAIALWGLGRKAESEAMLAQMITNNGDVGAFQIAEIYAFRGDKDEAFAWLERAHRQRDAGFVVFTHDPFFDSLKRDPRWTEFRRKLGLTETP